MKRFALWGAGFAVLLGFDLLVEAFVLPAVGLDGTPKNDLYFQAWWIAVGAWFLFGLPLLDRAPKPAA